MTLWIDNQLAPALAGWCHSRLGVDSTPVRDLGFQRASDYDIFMAAREVRAVVMTKDGDFVRLLERFGPPPQVLWMTCGNTSNGRVREILDARWGAIAAMIERGEALIEVGDQLDP